MRRRTFRFDQMRTPYGSVWFIYRRSWFRWRLVCVELGTLEDAMQDATLLSGAAVPLVPDRSVLFSPPPAKG